MPPRDADVGHVQMLREWIWRDFLNILLGVWLIASPFTLGYRSLPMLWSDVLSGGIVVILATLTLWPRFDPARWVSAAPVSGLLFAPLVFWTPGSWRLRQ